MSYACSSTASCSRRAKSSKNAGYRARATSSFIAFSNPSASSATSTWSIYSGRGIRRPCSTAETMSRP